jgi:large subunit ribosomal protein L13
MDTGDFVIIINADKVDVSGRKRDGKIYYRHSGYPGGLRSESFAKMIERKPTFPLEHAIKGMLPKGPLGRNFFRHVKIYAGDKHPHEAQKPEQLII